MSHQQWVTAVGKARKHLPNSDDAETAVAFPSVIEDYALSIVNNERTCADIHGMREYIYTQMQSTKKRGSGKSNANNNNDDDDDDGGGKMSDDHFVGKIFSSVPIGACQKWPGLWFMFRHAFNWRSSDTQRSKPDEALTYAFLCHLGYECYKTTAACIYDYPAGIRIRTDILEFVSEFCLPIVVIVQKDSQGSRRGGLSKKNPDWANWDYNVFNSICKHGAKLNDGLVPVDLTDTISQLDSVTQRNAYARQMKRLVLTLTSLGCAQNGINADKKNGLPAPVATAMDKLLKVRRVSAAVCVVVS